MRATTSEAGAARTTEGPRAPARGSCRGGPTAPASLSVLGGGTDPRRHPREADGGQVEHDLDALLADTQQERDEYLDLAKRTKADFENFRKRMTAEVQAAAGRGKAE